MAPSREIEKLQRRWQENPLGLTFAPLAEAYRKEGMYEDALELLSIGLAQHPNYVPAHIVRGRCYVDSHTDAAAEEAFQRVTELDPENVIALKGLADLAEKRGRVGEAIARLERLLEFDRNNDDARSQVDRLRTAQAQAWAAESAAVAADPVAFEPSPVDTSSAEVADAAAPPVESEMSDAEPAAAAVPEARADEGRAAVVDVSAADVEVITYHPLELVAAGQSEYQVADDAASLGAEPAEPAPPEAPVDSPVMDPAVSAVIEPVGIGSDATTPPTEDGAETQDDVAVGPEMLESAVTELVVTESVMSEPAGAEPTMSEVTEPAVAEPAVAALLGPQSAELPADSDDSVVEAATDRPQAGEPDATTDTQTAVMLAEEQLAASVAADVAAEPVGLEAASDDDDVAFDITDEVEALDLEQDDAEAVAGFEAEPDLVVTETMAELFLRQGHRALALAVYAQLSERDPDNPRIRGAIEQLQAELRPGSSVGIPAYAAVLTGGQSVRAFFEHLLATTRPTAPDRHSAGLSLGAVFGEEQVASPTPVVPDERGPSYDEFFAEEQPPAELPKGRDREGAAVDAASEDLEHFTSWLKGLKR